ncbi:MAG TPA: MASE1 domain-containing protein [Gemmatimonadales bacterium]|nr:MASE1 domain-containing protein [Gemmatimonadales bacterium]
MTTPTRRAVRALLAGSALLCVYVVAAKLGLRVAFAFPSTTPVWPATGLALAAYLLFGPRIWPAIFIGAFLVNLTTAGTPFTSLGIATGNTLEALVGGWLVARYANGREFLFSPQGIFRFTLLAALLSTTVSATLGTLTLQLGGLIPPGEFGPIWTTWWLGDASGDILVAPFLLAWATTPVTLPSPRRAFEGLALFGGLTLTGLMLFGVIAPLSYVGTSLKFLTIPFLTWAAVRFGPREASTATLLLGMLAIWGTLEGSESFGRPATNTTLLLLQAYMAVAALMTLTLAAAVKERRTAEERLRALAISDPLTGIANYRHLIAALEAEVERALRHGRGFAVLFLDVDGLKQINDRHGHLVGSRALCRVADTLRASARVVETPARYGGDEFALLLPETGEAEAWQVGRRLQERLTRDPEGPPIQVSLGVAVHPRDGATAEALLGAADKRLYEGRSMLRRDSPATPGSA